MKKTLLIAGLVLLTGVALVRCGGSGGGGTAKNPATEKAQFTDPTGNITSSNATTVMNDALNSTASNGSAAMGLAGVPIPSRLAFEKTIQQFKPGFRAAEGDISSCLSGVSGSAGTATATINVGCAIEKSGQTGCTGSGTIKYAFAGDTLTIDITSLSMSCSSEDINISNVNGQFVFLFSEDISAQTTAFEVWLLCINLSGTVDGESISFDGCVGMGGEYEGKFTVDGDGGSVLCSKIATNSGCTNVCADFTVNGDKAVAVTCKVTKPTTACSNWKEIEEISDCTFADGICGSTF